MVRKGEANGIRESVHNGMVGHNPACESGLAQGQGPPCLQRLESATHSTSVTYSGAGPTPHVAEKVK